VRIKHKTLLKNFLMSLSPKYQKRNAKTLPSFPYTLNPLMTFLQTNNSTIIQRTLQSRKLFSKVNKINALINDEKLKWNSPTNLSNMSGNQEKFNILMNKNNTLLQINPRIRMKKAIENIMKLNNIPQKTSNTTPKMKKNKVLSSTNFDDSKNNDQDFIDLRSINKNVKQISQISRYFDKVFNIDKKQTYLKIDTIDYWNKIDTTPTKKKELIQIYKKIHKDEKFSFSKYQKEYEAKWLDIMKNLQESDKAAIFFLINGGQHDDAEEEQIKTFDPSKIIQKLEYKLEVEEKKKRKTQPIFIPKPQNLTERSPINTFLSQKVTSKSRRMLQSESNLTIENRRNFSEYKENNQNSKLKVVPAFDQMSEVNSPLKIKSQLILKNFLNENLSKTGNKKPILKKSKISIDSENLKKFSQRQTSLKKHKKTHLNQEDIQECDCKHSHNIQCYQMKNYRKSIFKIPSVLPTTKTTFMEIRRASNMPYEGNLPHLNVQTLRNLTQMNEEENHFLKMLKTNIDESYEDGFTLKETKENEYILEKYFIIFLKIMYLFYCFLGMAIKKIGMN